MPAKTTMLKKVPEVTALFWTAKLLTTAMGESASDFFVTKYNPFLAVAIGAVCLLAVLIAQLRARRYIPWLYWLTAALVALVGTMGADGVHVQLGVSYAASTVFFAVVLAVIFAIWHKSEGTLSIHTVTTRRRELFYWATVMATFALGTAAGDLTAATLGLGYFWSGILFLGMILLPALAYRFLEVSEVATFWAAYIITRPLGASFADWFGKPRSVGGLGLGDGPVSLTLLGLLVITIVIMSTSRKPRYHPPSHAAPGSSL